MAHCIVYIEGSQGIISKKKHFVFSLKIDSALANSTDCDEMPLHFSLHCLPNYLFRGLGS